MAAPVPWEGAPRPPRKWQAEAMPVILDALRSDRRGIVAVATGGGKSILQAELAWISLPKAIALGRTVVVNAPRQALVRQLSATIAKRCGAAHVGQFYGQKKQPSRPIVVSCSDSLPSLATELAALGRPVSLFIADECHGTESATLRATIPALGAKRLIGFTATAFRSDNKQALGLFDEVLFRYTYDDARRDGVLVDYVTLNWDGEGERDTDAVCAEMIAKHAHGPTIVSATDIKDATAYAAYLSERGIPAAAIHSKQAEAERAGLLERLRTGVLRVLVHVSLLAEGVDLPWLRCLVLRRNVGARVRFVQELGRVLRVCSPFEDWYEEDKALWGEKLGAIVIDPYDLMTKMGIKHPEAVGQAMAEEEEKLARKALDEMDAKERAAEIKKMPDPVAVDQATAWAQRLLLEMQGAGLATAYAASPETREARPSRSQLAYLAKLGKMTRYLPEPHREPIKALVARAEELTWGGVSDLISTLKGIATASAERRREQKHWHMPGEVVERIEALDGVVAGRLELTAKERKKAAAAAAKVAA